MRSTETIIGTEESGIREIIERTGIRSLLGAVSLLALTIVTGCTASQLQTAQTDASAVVTALNDACKGALTAAATAQGQLKGGALNTANSVAQYVVAGCQSEATIAALATSPSSIAWVGSLTGTLNTLASGTAPAAAAS